MKNVNRKAPVRKVAKGFKVQSSVRAGMKGSYNSRDSYGSDYGSY